MENREREIGWPLGLGSMYMRLRLMESLGVNGASSSFPSTSFSSFTSSNFDTESTTSFFQDNSKTLGRLIGIRPCNKTRSEFRSTSSSVIFHCSEPQQLPNTTCSKHEDELDLEMCDGLCIPLCLNARTSKNNDNSKR